MQNAQRVAVLVLTVGCIFMICERGRLKSFSSLDNIPTSIKRKTLSLQPLNFRKLEDINGVNFAAAKALAQKALNLIQKRYELDTPLGKGFFFTANNMQAQTWDIMKYKFASKMLLKNQTFLMTFGGSSVTAGHDNYFNQSYPMVVERRMSPILKALGVEMQVHNIAQGANNCVPYILCYEAMGGLDPDFVGWEQSYNCGHDDSVFEMAGRIAGYSKNKGVAYFSASGAWNPEKCPNSPTTPAYASENWDPVAAGLPVWQPELKDLQTVKDQLSDYNKAHASSARFTSWTGSNAAYSGVGAHGFNVWEANPKTDCTVKGEKRTECTGIDAAGECALKFMTHEAGVYGQESGKGAGWHPPVGFHMLRGEFIAYLYTLPLLESILMVEEDLKKNKASELITKYTTLLKELQPPMPKPAKCQNLNCNRRPTCYTNFMPHYSPDMTLSELLVGNVTWTVDEYATMANMANRSRIYSDWSLKYGYLDAKPVIATPSKDYTGELHLKITIGDSDFVWLCGSGKEPLKFLSYYLDQNVPNPGPDYIPSTSRVPWTKKKYVGSECKEVFGLPKGQHVLSIADNTTTGHIASLTHVIMWP